jgi:hypothetical protein
MTRALRTRVLVSGVLVALAMPARAFADGGDEAGTAVGSAAPPAPPDSAAAAAKPPPPPPTPSFFSWEPFGFLRLEYEYVQPDPNVAFVGHNNGFEIQNARVGVTGHMGSRIGFVVSIDGAVDERTQVNEPQGNLAVGLRDAFVDVRVLADQPLVVRAGYFQTLTDPEALVPDTSREFVDKPIESVGVPATEGYQTPGLPPGRSQGVALRYDPHVGREDGVALGFELAAQNGADEFASQNDNNSLALSASGLLALPHGGWLVASIRYNPRTVGMLPFLQNEDDLQGSFGAHYLVGPVSLTGGLIVERTTFPTTGGPTQDAYGGHAQAMVRLFSNRTAAFWAGYRFDVLDPSNLVTTDRVINHTAGILLVVPRYRMRLQAEGVIAVEQPGRELQNDRVEVAGEVVF